MNERTREIHDKGFDMKVGRTGNEEYVPPREGPIDFTKLKVGIKAIENPIFNMNAFKVANPKADKETVMKAIKDGNLELLKDLSNFFYKTSGVYSRLVKYMANLYRYDSVVVPVVSSSGKVKPDKVIEGFNKALLYLDNFNPKKTFGEISLKVIRNGVFYGYLVRQTDRVAIQELPTSYCRSRFISNGRPVVEFNMRYFDDAFKDTNQKIRVLKTFPVEFQKGYVAYKEGRLTPDFIGDSQGWYVLDSELGLKFCMNGDDYPPLISVIPAIIDLEEAKELDKRKMQQQLLKVITQVMPIDKNGELVFDVDEAKALHNNAVAMLGNAIGVDVLTTFAEVDTIDLAQKSTVATMDELGKVERSVYNEAGVSQGQFNTDGNMALEKSIANDEAAMENLILQFELLLNDLLAPFNTNPNKVYYRVQLLRTTIYNFKELSKLYKEQMQLGFSKILPQIALGQSQSSILATAYFENEILKLNELFVPPAMSSTQSGKEPAKPAGDKGRPELPDDKKSDKTIKNKESIG